jgi:NADPH:quinone reductase-like Zn-dependent oxidoreductase
MQAIVREKYGSPDVLHLQEVPQPVPLEDEVLIRVHATSINARDWRMLRAKPFFIRLTKGGLLKPKNQILGVDVAGRVEAVGGSVRQYKPGDEVFGYLYRYGGRTLAEYVCASENEIALKPAKLTYEEAAAVPLAAITALQAVRDRGQIQPGQKVLIYGASGGVGTYAVQIAIAYGARVTGVCSSRNLQMVRSLGADSVLDYTKDDALKPTEPYDLILAVNGYQPISRYLDALKPVGICVIVGGAMLQLFQAARYLKQAKGGPKVSILTLRRSPEDLIQIKELLETGKIKPLVDRCYPLQQTPQAFLHFEKEHPQGKIVILMTKP